MIKILPIVLLLLPVSVIAKIEKIKGLIKVSANHVLHGHNISLFEFNVRWYSLKTVSSEKGEFFFDNIKESDFKI